MNLLFLSNLLCLSSTSLGERVSSHDEHVTEVCVTNILFDLFEFHSTDSVGCYHGYLLGFSLLL